MTMMMRERRNRVCRVAVAALSFALAHAPPPPAHAAAAAAAVPSARAAGPAEAESPSPPAPPIGGRHPPHSLDESSGAPGRQAAAAAAGATGRAAAAAAGATGRAAAAAESRCGGVDGGPQDRLLRTNVARNRVVTALAQGITLGVYAEGAGVSFLHLCAAHAALNAMLESTRLAWVPRYRRRSRHRSAGGALWDSGRRKPLLTGGRRVREGGTRVRGRAA
eukprot:GHVU01070069.1.p1 GENE.GHVU01070069.1~~GHVU01070069.1.p1  ORF type:complete len:221 (-),score=32.92 GHVU01070069.1:583-1245(-)